MESSKKVFKNIKKTRISAFYFEKINVYVKIKMTQKKNIIILFVEVYDDFLPLPFL